MSFLTVGVCGTSQKKHEKRVPVHPIHLESIDKEIRRNLVFETNYGLPFGFSNEHLASLSAGIANRSKLLEKCDIVLLAKPLREDFVAMKSGAIHWGWPHCVQQQSITQAAIDRKQTLIAWEAMHQWSAAGEWQKHTFHKNNELAGYAGVQHAMNLVGIDGNFGPKLKASVISYGSVSQGAIRALQSRGVNDITVFTPTGVDFNTDKIHGLNYRQFDQDENGDLYIPITGGPSRVFAEELGDSDIIVNGILQDTDRPFMFVPAGRTDQLKANCLIVDVSCDEGMGFSFASPTSFDDPMFDVGSVHYYAVDHTPSLLWNCASWEISKSLIPYLPVVMRGPESWQNNETIRRAIEIQEGVIQNPKILSFQKRNANHPHEING